MSSNEMLQQLATALAVMLPNKKLVAVTIVVDMRQHQPDLEYPLLDEDAAELIPAGDREVDPSNPETYLYQKQLDHNRIETVVIYALPDDFDTATLELWREALQGDPKFNGFIQRVKIETFFAKAGN